MNVVSAWIESNPVLFTAVIWPLVTAIITAVLKPRSPEQYAAMNPRVAAFLKLLGALGLDVPNMLNAVKQLIAGSAHTAESYRARREAIGQPSPPST